MDTNLAVQLGILAAVIVTAVAAWFREGRAHRWSLEAAAKLAEKLREENAALAKKVNDDALALATKQNADAAVVAKDLIADALRISEKVQVAAEKLADTVTINTEISTKAAQGAHSAFVEANSQNSKIINMGSLIADLSSQVVEIANHIRRTEEKSLVAEKAAHDECVFNKAVKAAKAAIDTKLAEMNCHTERILQTRKSNRSKS